MTEKSATLQRLQLADALVGFPSSRLSSPHGGGSAVEWTAPLL